MRYRFVDRVTAFEPWKSIAGRKVVSLEEYYLLERLGRQGVFPESLVLECCTELVRLLVAVSSSFEWSVLLEDIENFRFEQEAAMSELLDLEARVVEKRASQLSAECRVAGQRGITASGLMGFVLVPLGECFEARQFEGMWRERRAGA